MTADLEPPTPASGIPDCDVCGESLDDHDRCEDGPLHPHWGHDADYERCEKPVDVLDRIRALALDQAVAALCFLSGYCPADTDAALDYVDRTFAASPPAVGRGDDAPAPVPPAGAGAEPEAVTS